MGQFREGSPVDTSVNEFLEFLAVEKGASGNTIAAYRNDLGQMEEFLSSVGKQNGNGAGVPWLAINQNQVYEYILHLKGQSYAEATVARKVAAVKSFFSFLQAEGKVKVNPTETLASPKVGKSLPKPLTVQEIDELLEQPMRRATPEAKRDRAMLELMYATGLRVTELVSLDVADCQLEGDKPFVRLVGERQIPLLDQPVQEVTEYIKFARPRLVGERDETALFVNRRGERLTRQGFWLILKGYAQEANIVGRVTPHTLRHSFATHMLRGGMDIHKVQELLGHANISTTQVYTQVSREHIREAYEKAHPRAV